MSSTQARFRAWVFGLLANLEFFSPSEITKPMSNSFIAGSSALRNLPTIWHPGVSSQWDRVAMAEAKQYNFPISAKSIPT